MPTASKISRLEKGSESGIICNLPWCKCLVVKKIFCSLQFSYHLKIL